MLALTKYPLSHPPFPLFMATTADIPGVISRAPSLKRLAINKAAAAFFKHKNGQKAWLDGGTVASCPAVQWRFLVRTDSPTFEATWKLFKGCKRVRQATGAVLAAELALDSDVRRTVELVVINSFYWNECVNYIEWGE
jgi:hypothetical protein